MDIKNIQFKTTVLENSSRYHSVYFEPKFKSDVISNFLITFRSSKSTQELIRKLRAAKDNSKSHPIEITHDESHIRINENIATFDMELVTELKPIKLNIESAIKLFEKYNDYLLKYENCKIPGLIPEDKLNSFEIVKITK